MVLRYVAGGSGELDPTLPPAWDSLGEPPEQHQSSATEAGEEIRGSMPGGHRDGGFLFVFLPRAGSGRRGFEILN